MDPHEKLKVGRSIKEEGNDYYKRGKLPEAQKSYTKVLNMLREEISFTGDDQKKERKSLILAAHLNLAQCALQLGDYGKVIDHCNTALDLDSNNVKAHFRRAKAFENLSEYAKALEGYQTVLRLEPNNSAAQKQQSECQKKFSRERSMEQMSHNTRVIEVEMVPEFYEAAFESCYKNCKKNPGHKEFINVADFQINHLPPDYRDEDLFACLKHQVQLTCLLEVKGSSEHRPEYDLISGDKYPFFGKRYRRTKHRGSGLVTQVHPNNEEKLCPCTECQRTGMPKERWAEIRVLTARHVVYDETEAKNTSCVFFFDTEKQLKSCPRICNGVTSLGNPFDGNLLTFISHDQILIDILDKERAASEQLQYKLDIKYKSESSAEEGTEILRRWIQRFQSLHELLPELRDVHDRFRAICNADPATEYQKYVEKQRKAGVIGVLGHMLLDKLNGGSVLQNFMKDLSRYYKNCESTVSKTKALWFGIDAIGHGYLPLTEKMIGEMEVSYIRIESHKKVLNFSRAVLAGEDTLPVFCVDDYKKAHPLAVIVSHPHGCSKKISLGEVTDRIVHHSYKQLARFIYSTPTCPGSSGAAVFVLGYKIISDEPVHSCGESVEPGGRQRNMNAFHCH